MDRHLITVKVGVECRTHERMNPDCLTLDKDRFESLDAQPMQSRSPI